MNELVLEQSTNTHLAKSEGITGRRFEDGSVLMRCPNGQSQVTHGEHGVMVTEGRSPLKINQMEVDVLTKKLVQAYD